MELTQGMELAQVLKLSPGLLQSMEMLQMNTLELGAYLKELALENPVLEEAEPGQGQDTWEAFASQVWDSLNADNKVSLYINWIDLATGEESVRIFNKNQ